jgi:hypothetical protein
MQVTNEECRNADRMAKSFGSEFRWRQAIAAKQPFLYELFADGNQKLSESRGHGKMQADLTRRSDNFVNMWR